MEFSNLLAEVVDALGWMGEAERIEALNQSKVALHAVSPFVNEPVDCVLWVRASTVVANDYNPNSVAPPEMKLLETSIMADGYTQPIVADYDEEKEQRIVVDGFHRHRVGCESMTVQARVKGYLPVVQIRSGQKERGARIASTIRHNRARGKHQVDKMSDIVVELKRRNWSGEKIGRELGMDTDEVLRLCQISGLREVFSNQEFSKAWELDDEWDAASNESPVDLADDDGGGRSAYEPNQRRVYHTWEKWECYKAGFYEDKPRNMTQDEGEERYRAFLADPSQFEAALDIVTTQWPHSCEYYLTNERMNRIAWLGQASVAQALGIPSCCRGGYHRLTSEQQQAADTLALQYLNRWLAAHGDKELSFEEAQSKTQADLY